MSATADALVIEGQVASKLVDLLAQTLDKVNMTEQERDQAKQQAADLISEDQKNASAVSELTAKFQAVLDKAAGATPAPAAPATPVDSTPATPTAPPATPTAPSTPIDSSAPTAPSVPVSEVPVSNSADGTPTTPVVPVNPVGDASASTTAQ